MVQSRSILVWIFLNNVYYYGSVHAFSPSSTHSLSKTSATNRRTKSIGFLSRRNLYFTEKQNLAVLSSSSVSSSSSDVVPPPFPSQLPSNNNRGRVNEIDFCMAPSDVSLSRYYNSYKKVNNSSDFLSSDSSDDKVNMGTAKANVDDISDSSQAVSLTRALNNASNRALRRILLSRSWPSAEALNLSLRQYLSSSSSQSADSVMSNEKNEISSIDDDDVPESIKCPIPRPILNIIMRRREDSNSIDSPQKDVLRTDKTNSVTVQSMESSNQPTKYSTKRGRTDKEYVMDQISLFRESYEEVPGYQLAESYLECILSLATSGEESPKVKEVLTSGVYDESYRRFMSVLQSVGTVFEEVEVVGGNEPITTNERKLKKISPKLVDQDICLSMLDKIAMRKEENEKELKSRDSKNASINLKEKETNIEVDKKDDVGREDVLEEEESKDIADNKGEGKRFKFPFFFMSRRKKYQSDTDSSSSTMENKSDQLNSTNVTTNSREQNEEQTQIEPGDLGAVLLSAEEPSMTRQLNILTNIVQRALLFGGDKELLVLSETLEADKSAFVQRWYPNDEVSKIVDENKEERPGVQFLNCLVQLMKNSYGNGVVIDLEPPFPLIQSYRNSYERLMATLVELGSGYIKPLNRKREIILGTIPKTPKEEFGRFAEWEVNIRQASPDVSSYPDDLIGEWQVQDEIGGETIGVSTVILAQQGEVVLKPPLTGLRWRLDPGPTHLDTCTFQFLSDDGDIFQYKGFIDRGARLESRFSKRPIKIRGAVTFQMRDGDATFMSKAYRKDMLPLDVKTGTTRFVMTKSSESKK